MLDTGGLAGWGRFRKYDEVCHKLLSHGADAYVFDNRLQGGQKWKMHNTFGKQLNRLEESYLKEEEWLGCVK